MDWMKLVHKPVDKGFPSVNTGDDVRIWYKIREQDRERLGQFEGVVIRHRGAGPSKTITVRRVTYGEGVERVFPLDAPVIERIELLRRGKTRRSRIYFLRRVVKKTRLASADAAAGGQAPGAQAGTASAVSAAAPQPVEISAAEQAAEHAIAAAEKSGGARKSKAKA